MDQMLPSPSFNIPSIGTPHHAMEEDQMIAPSAQEAQQTARQQNLWPQAHQRNILHCPQANTMQSSRHPW